jgi:hypothetical protein
MKKQLITPLSWILAIAVSAIFVRVAVISIVGHFETSLWQYLIIPIFLFAVPFYVIIKKEIMRNNK